MNIFYSSYSDSTNSTNATQPKYTCTVEKKKKSIHTKFAEYNIIVKSQYLTAPC